ncbi:MAG: class I SAM-dependent methyltransferase [Maribacter sp.]|nr:class I SAM-dependent methyltransferase [Maribacter sp.]
MKEIQNNFSKQSSFYKKYRPNYPIELINDILRITSGRDYCWDCGTGNGQVAIELSNHFERVYATDISEKQIASAFKRENIEYSVGRSEETAFNKNKFDLITVAQAIHWFDFRAFNKEINRVAKNGAIVAIWGYGLLRIETSIDLLIDRFYRDTIGPYWNQERKYVDAEYATIALDFKEISLKKNYQIKTKWTLEALKGYLNSWSSVQNYIVQNQENPVNGFVEDLKKYWKKDTIKEITFPIFTRIGRIEK